MRLSRQKALLLILVSSAACSGATGPETVAAFFELKSINGRPLPTYLAATPGPSRTVISSNLTLYKSGKAVMVEHRDDMFTGEGTYTTNYNYRIQGNQIVVGTFQCPINADCASYMKGTISPLSLNLVINPASVDFQIVYEYRGFGAD
jgi:hypothetical protein